MKPFSVKVTLRIQDPKHPKETKVISFESEVLAIQYRNLKGKNVPVFLVSSEESGFSLVDSRDCELIERDYDAVEKGERGPKGDKGSKGDKGDKGEKGSKGK